MIIFFPVVIASTGTVSIIIIYMVFNPFIMFPELEDLNPKQDYGNPFVFIPFYFYTTTEHSLKLMDYFFKVMCAMRL